MLRSLFAVLLIPLVGVTAPVPKQTEKEKIEAKFGKIVDPKGDSTFTLDGEALKITLPANEERRFGYVKDLAEKSGLKRFDNTPRLEFPRTDDFVLTVRVNFPLATDAEIVKDQEWMFVGGGVKLVTAEEKLYWFGAVNKFAPHRHVTVVRSGSPGTWSNDFRDTFYHDPLSGSGSAWFRVIRTGDNLSCDASTDGKEWKTISEHRNAAKGESVALALYAEHSSTKVHTVTFDQFSIEKPKAEKK